MQRKIDITKVANVVLHSYNFNAESQTSAARSRVGSGLFCQKRSHL